MPFVWNPNPNPPPPIVPTPVPPGEVSSEVALVANTVNYGGVLRYSTANKAYDIVYEFPELNVKVGLFENGEFETANIGNVVINVATIGHATINTANITNATITFAYATSNPTTNTGIATKLYVDNAIAAISQGTGPDSTVNLFTTKADLLVGISPNTAQRFGVGTDGQVFTVNTSTSLKSSWKQPSSSQVTTALFIGTHYHPTLKLTQVLLTHADSIVMNNGEYIAGWDGLTADITISGVGGLDSNSVRAANTWYEVYAIRNSSTGAKSLLLHRMVDMYVDSSWSAATGFSGTAMLRSNTTLLSSPDQRYLTKISQSFKPITSGRMRGVDLQIQKSGSPVGNVWITIEGDDGTGNADGNPIATSRSYESFSFGGSYTTAHFIFDTAPNVAAGNKYLIVAQGDWPFGDPTGSPSLIIYGNTAPLGPGQQTWMANVGYNAGGSTYSPYDTIPSMSGTLGYGDARCYNVASGTWKMLANTGGFGGPQDLWFNTYIEEHNTSLSLPTGYNQYALISYVCTNGSSNFKEYHQQQRTLTMGFDNDWVVHNSGTQNQLVVAFIPILPPIPCTVQFFCWSTNPTFAASFPFMVGDLYMLDMGLTATQDMLFHGSYPLGPGGSRPHYSGIITLDGTQFLSFREVSSGYTTYLTNMTF